jgi:hypothetical protein
MKMMQLLLFKLFELVCDFGVFIIINMSLDHLNNSRSSEMEDNPRKEE